MCRKSLGLLKTFEPNQYTILWIKKAARAILVGEKQILSEVAIIELHVFQEGKMSTSQTGKIWLWIFLVT